jgi:predicted SAM-dependent methyltransferase
LQSSKRILALGCGNQIYGTDRLDFIKTEATTLVCDIENGIPYPNEVFDEVYSHLFLEHLANVGAHLKECYRVLKQGGVVDVTTDNAGCQRYYWHGIATHGGRYEKLHPKGDRHFSIFTKNHLLNHFEVAGFKDIQINYVKTDTLGKWLDYVTFQKPRIRVTATKP